MPSGRLGYIYIHARGPDAAPTPENFCSPKERNDPSSPLIYLSVRTMSAAYLHTAKAYRQCLYTMATIEEIKSPHSFITPHSTRFKIKIRKDFLLIEKRGILQALNKFIIEPARNSRQLYIIFGNLNIEFLCIIGYIII